MRPSRERERPRLGHGERIYFAEQHAPSPPQPFWVVFAAGFLVVVPQQALASAQHLSPSWQQVWTAAQQALSLSQQLMALVQQPSLVAAAQQVPSFVQQASFLAQQSCATGLSLGASEPVSSRPSVRTSPENRFVSNTIQLP